MGSSIPSSVPVIATAAAAATENSYSKDDPPDVEQLGRSSWTLLHSIGAKYPINPSAEQQNDITNFLQLFGKLYPCWFCAKDFNQYLSENKPKVKTQEDLNRWLCDAHNEVNAKLGKPTFDCNLWKQRWKDGSEDTTKTV